MKKIKGGITSPKGFKASGINCGIKEKKLDLALIRSDIPAVACGVFTTNSFKAAPVIVSRENLAASKAHRAVIINSGNANCLTGRAGLEAAKAMVKGISFIMGCSEEQVLVCSTGIIGKKMPVDKIKSGLAELYCALSKNGHGNALKAIMTTDAFKKESAYSFKIGGKEVRIAGIAKGAGMIAPNMATMLCFITTDAKIEKPLLQRALKASVDSSFNIITVDGTMSTNDTVLVFANGASGVDIGKSKSAYDQFVSVLTSVCLDLAKMMVKDGEGATKFIEIDVVNAKTARQAKDAALGIANANLFKTMCFGEDPNFGRVAAACGTARTDIDASRADIYLNKKLVVRNGVAIVPGKLPQSVFKGDEISVKVNLKSGKESIKIYTSDLTPEYLKINASYN